MKKINYFVINLFLLSIFCFLPQIACAVPNYDIHYYDNISLTGYIKCELKNIIIDQNFIVYLLQTTHSR